MPVTIIRPVVWLSKALALFTIAWQFFLFGWLPNEAPILDILSIIIPLICLLIGVFLTNKIIKSKPWFFVITLLIAGTFIGIYVVLNPDNYGAKFRLFEVLPLVALLFRLPYAMKQAA